MNESSAQAKRTLAVLSPEYLQSFNCMLEWTPALQHNQLLLVRIKKTKLDGIPGPCLTPEFRASSGMHFVSKTNPQMSSGSPTRLYWPVASHPSRFRLTGFWLPSYRRKNSYGDERQGTVEVWSPGPLVSDRQVEMPEPEPACALLRMIRTGTSSRTAFRDC